jgi:polyisoprenoid-binding protein YceI
MRASEVLCALLLLPTLAAAEPYQPQAGSEVRFVAHITGGTFVARSETLSGDLEIDRTGKKLQKASLVIAADSFKSGLSLRDEHMRDKYLEAGRFPQIRFVVGEQPVDPTPGRTTRVEGKLTLKETTRPLAAEVKVESGAADEVTVTATFQVNVTEFGIPQPAFAVVKMNPVVDVTVRLALRRAR